MKLGIYPGSFNPFHRGHLEVLTKALTIFETVIVARGVNPEKYYIDKLSPDIDLPKGAEYAEFKGLLVDFANEVKANAIIKGIRNAQDLENERVQQYWNETELGLTIPTFYILASPNLVHVSSSAIRALNKIKNK